MLSRRQVFTAGLCAALLPPAARAADLLRVPFDLNASGKPVIAVTLDGQGPFRFLVDTGAGSSGIRESLAQKLGLRVLGTARGNVLGAQTTHAVYAASNVTFGTAYMQNEVSFGALPEPSASAGAAASDGLLAAGFLTTLPSELDFDAREIRLYPHGGLDMAAYPPLTAFERRDSDNTSDKIYVKATLEGREVTLLLDTGAGPEVYLSSDYVKKHKMWNGFEAHRDLKVAGATGVRLNRRLVKTRNLQIDGIRFDETYISLGDPNRSDNLGFLKADGIMGIRLISQFTLAFGGDRFGIKPNSRFKPVTDPVKLDPNPDFRRP
ncbi:MAG: aspartyl protease family protein [Asticcacaulis sp.]